MPGARPQGRSTARLITPARTGGIIADGLQTVTMPGGTNGVKRPRPPYLRSRAEIRLLLTALVGGFAYGLLVRLLFSDRLPESALFGAVFAVMSVAFLFLMPLALGFLVVSLGERAGAWPVRYWLMVPWVPACAALAAALLLAWEGLICIVLWLPLFMVMSSLGGLASGWWGRRRRRLRGNGGGAVLAGVLLLPFVVAPMESRFAAPVEVRRVATSIEIATEPGAVWREIVAVPPIRREEQGWHLVHVIGFPRPIEAKSFGTGVGSIRHATFDRGVLFVETVTRFEVARALAFSIAADPDTIPAQALDQHVTVGGPYFDVLEGEYTIEAVAPGRVRLHLASRHRLSTHFNFYAGAWTDFILRDVQENILEVVKRRAERRYP